MRDSLKNLFANLKLNNVLHRYFMCSSRYRNAFGRSQSLFLGCTILFDQQQQRALLFLSASPFSPHSLLAFYRFHLFFWPRIREPPKVSLRSLESLSTCELVLWRTAHGSCLSSDTIETRPSQRLSLSAMRTLSLIWLWRSTGDQFKKRHVQHVTAAPWLFREWGVGTTTEMLDIEGGSRFLCETL